MIKYKWCDSYITYNVTDEERIQIRKQMRGYKEMNTDNILDVIATPAFLVLINPKLMSDNDVEILKEFMEYNEKDELEKRNVYLTFKDKRLNQIDIMEKILDSDEKIYEALSYEKERNRRWKNKNIFVNEILSFKEPTLIAARPAMGRKRVAIEIAQRYIGQTLNKVYFFSKDKLAEKYINEIYMQYPIEFICEKSFEEICDFFKQHNKEKCMCIIADIDWMSDFSFAKLYKYINVDFCKVVLNTRCSRDVEERRNHRPTIDDVLDFDNYKSYIGQVILIYRRAYYYFNRKNKIDFSIYNLKEDSNKNITLYWEWEKCFV